MAPEQKKPIKIFYCYAHEDRALRDQLEKHLTPLKHSGQIANWYDHEISAGTEWKADINTHLDTADIVLLLVSADFMSSDYCYGVEMQRALKRYREGKCRVIPVILRPVILKDTFISELQQLPAEGKPVTSWDNLDTALHNVALGIYKMIELIRDTKEELQEAEAEYVRRAERKVESERIIRLQKRQQNNQIPIPSQKEMSTARQSEEPERPSETQSYSIHHQRARSNAPSASQSYNKHLYPNSNKGRLISSRRILINTGSSWIWPFIIAIFILLILWITGTSMLSWGAQRLDDLQYGLPRTYQIDAVVGHGDNARHPSHFIAINYNNQAIVTEWPAGDPTKALSYVVPLVIAGNHPELVPITLTFRDVTDDGKPDMLIYIHILGQEQVSVFVNTNNKFRPSNNNDRINL